MSDEAFYRCRFCGSNLRPEVVIAERHGVAKALGLPADRLYPDDRFLKDYVLVPGVPDDALYDLFELARARCPMERAAVDGARMDTLEEYIRAMGALRGGEIATPEPCNQSGAPV